MNYKLILPAAAIIAGTVFGVSQVSAQSDGNYPPIIERLAERFGLNQDEVKAVFDEERQERQEEMQTRFEARLDEAIQNVNLTAEQKQLILDKHEELKSNHQAEMEEMRDLTPEERRAKMQEHRAELESWAESNGLDLGYFMLGGPDGGHHGAMKFGADWTAEN